MTTLSVNQVPFLCYVKFNLDGFGNGAYCPSGPRAGSTMPTYSWPIEELKRPTASVTALKRLVTSLHETLEEASTPSIRYHVDLPLIFILF